MYIIKTPSPNYDNRPVGSNIDTIIIHYTDMANAAEAVQCLCDEASKVSSHYLIDEAGKIYQLVDDAKRAWHAGESHWAGRSKINDFSIGIELANPGHSLGYVPFPPEQMNATIMLCQILCQHHPIKQSNILAHSDVAPTRKMDPGELFDWQMLADYGIGIFPDVPKMELNPALLKLGDEGRKVHLLQQKLSHYGYLVHMNSLFDEYLAYVVKAFKRHFHQDVIDAVWDQRSDVILNQLLTVLGYCA